MINKARVLTNAVPRGDEVWRNLQDLQLVVDPDGTYLAANEAWTRMLGWLPEQVVGRTHADFVHPDDLTKSVLALVRASSEQLPTFENRFRHKDGSYRWISWVAAHETNLLYASGRDITAEKEAAAKLATTQEQLRQAQKMELLGQLTGGIAHDFNNLLGIIHLNLELIRDAASKDVDIKDMANMALQAAERGASLTHQLLAYARQQPLEPKVVNVEKLLSAMTALFGRTIGENIEIKIIVPPGLWTTRIDPHQLENALLNLAINARDAMPGGGKLIIKCANKVFDDIYADQNVDVAPGQYVTIAVTDTGTGMSKETLERVLEPFFTTKPVGKGSGLGLSMVHGFAKQSGGHLKIYSELGHGTTVNLHLPRAAADSMEHRETSHAVEVPVAKGLEVVLVVEDDRDLRSLTLRVLKGLGYHTIEAEDGPAACRILENTGRIDLLLTDVVLPNGMQGPELARQARLRRPALKVIYMSGYPRDAVFRDGLLDNRMLLLTKPFPKLDLARMVRESLDENSIS
jgi:PAS domain S-box-containing protein